MTKLQTATTYQYVESLTNPEGLFRTMGEVVVELDIYDEPKFRLGNNAIVFRVEHQRQPLMMKCYIKEQRFKEQIYSYLATALDPLLSPTRLLKDELFVYDMFDKGSWLDVVVSHWVEGNILEIEIRRAVMEYGAARIRELSRAFVRLSLELLKKEWAHGDLKPENIVVKKGGDIVLIDYDAMFIPSLGGQFSSEIGTPSYQHPKRDQTLFSKEIDDYSIALIAVSLLALELEPELYRRYNSGDNIILNPQQIIEDRSECYAKVLSLFTLHSRPNAHLLAQTLTNPMPQIHNLERLLNLVLEE